ncbi:ribosomal protein S12 methylthiotransferase accessory factor YcaO [Streptomyces sp. 3330]|uniref:YcaO-like family protein n=1 Tax=Streptomyces sp. 3330 TaxID=2817755 RepID=UPI0028582BB0|nr:YcaO-like family protein [Streptomyces sp. 3330]MDR6981006.1 ribosomal protein S12 methylthiotransferase accessory factor YcaO [Streptomyces sp. 3330]
MSQAFVVHPDCWEHPYGDERWQALDSKPDGLGVHAPFGPLLLQQVVEDASAGVWSSDVLVTVPRGTRGFPAVVGGGMAATAEQALTLGWIEAFERRCSFRRPREQLIFAVQPPGLAMSEAVAEEAPMWWTQAHGLDGEPTWLPLQEAVLASQWRGTPPVTTDTTGMSAHTSKERAILHGLREWLERSVLHRWWTQPDSTRCSIHSRMASDLMRGSSLALPDSACEVWHLRHGDWHVAGCVIFTERGIRPTAAFGGGTALTADAAVNAAWREAFQMHIAPQPAVTREGQIVFGPPIGHTPVDEDFRIRFLAQFPARSDCTEPGREEPIDHAEEAGTRDSILKVVDGPVATVDCGDELTDALGLHVLRVLCPALPRFTPDTRTPSGLAPAFLGG